MAEPLGVKPSFDTTDFKAGLRSLNDSLKVLNSEFKAQAATLGDWSKSSQGLEERIGFLDKAIDLQSKKVQALKAQQKALADSGKASASEQAAMATKVNNATAELNKMERELKDDKKALDDMGKSAKTSAVGMNLLKSAASGLWVALKAGVAVSLALVGALAALGGIIAKLVFSAAELADGYSDLSAKTGISVTRLQELDYASRQLGVDQDTLTGSMARLTRSIYTAQQQAGDYAKQVRLARASGEPVKSQLGDMAAAFERLKVPITDASGNLRDNEAVFNDVLTALGRMNNETERDAIAMQLFGKSAQELNPLIKAGAAGIADLTREAHKFGAVISEEDVKALAEFQDLLESLKSGLKGTLGTLASAFLPGFKAIFTQAGGYLQQFAAIVKGADGDIGKITRGVLGLVQRIVTDLARQAPALMKSGLNLLLTIVKSIISSLPAMIPAAIQIILSLVSFMLENLPLLIKAGMDLLIGLINGLSAALPQLIPVLLQAIVLIIQVLSDNAPLLAQAASSLIGALVAGIVANLPLIIKSALQIIKALYDTIGPIAILKLLYNIGKGFVDGIRLGFNNSWQEFVNDITKNFEDLLAYLKSLLGIASPSKVTANWGKNLALGMGAGFNDQFAKVRAGMESAVGAMTLSPTLSMAGAGAGAGGGGSRSLTLNLNIGGASMTQVRQAIGDSEQGILSAVAGALRRL